MSAGSPTAYLLWAILSVIFLIFLLAHLWSYDRFQCIKWSSGKQPGAFKRLMTYTYLASVPLLVVFSVGMARIKYIEGFVTTFGTQIIPTPWELWSESDKKWLLPLYFCLSVGWAFEIVTHLEELTFWLFLLHQGPSQRQWFRSWEFRMWYIGSAIAVVGMPLTTLLARQDLSTTLAWILLVGSSASTCTTICFLYVLARFPQFIEHVKAEHAEPGVVVRLATFYQLNRIRVVFRFVFTVPFFIIAADGIQPPYPIVGNLFAIDLLLMTGAFGSFVSSGITLFVFFPRSIAEEAGYQVQERMSIGSVLTHSLSGHLPHPPYHQVSKVGLDMPDYEDAVCMRQIDSRPMSRRSRFSTSAESATDDPIPGYDTGSESVHPQPLSYRSRPMTKRLSMPSRDSATQTEDSAHGQAHCIARRHSDGDNLHRKATHVMPLSSTVVPPRERRQSQLGRYLVNFTSPIDLPDDDYDDRGGFSRHRAPP